MTTGCGLASSIAPTAFVGEFGRRLGTGVVRGPDRNGAAAVWSVIVNSSDVSRWFGEYLDAFAACGRGERDTASLLADYGVSLLLTTDDGLFARTSDNQVAAAQR